MTLDSLTQAISQVQTSASFWVLGVTFGTWLPLQVRFICSALVHQSTSFQPNCPEADLPFTNTNHTLV